MKGFSQKVIDSVVAVCRKVGSELHGEKDKLHNDEKSHPGRLRHIGQEPEGLFFFLGEGRGFLIHRLKIQIYFTRG
jgi:hypothetical protein